MSKKPKPSLDLDTGVDLQYAPRADALAILNGLGCTTPHEDCIQLIQEVAARARADLELGAFRPSGADQAATLKRLQAWLKKLELADALGPRQRQRVEAWLTRGNSPPPNISEAWVCLTYFRDTLALWQIGVQEKDIPVPAAIEPPFRNALDLLSRMNEYSEGALLNWLYREFRGAKVLEAGSDHVDTLEYCRQRILSATKPAIDHLSKAGRPPNVGLHTAVTRLALCYGHLTGHRPSYHGAYDTRFWHDDDERPAGSFAEFAHQMLVVGRQQVPLNSLHQAIESYCSKRNAREHTNPAQDGADPAEMIRIWDPGTMQIRGEITD